MSEQEERALHLVGEDTRNRGEKQKQFRREDGMRVSVVYDHPVHYKKDGAWERIDNTLRREKGKEGTEVYRNAASSLEAELAAELSAKKTVSLTHKGKTLSWRLEGLEKGGKGEILPAKEEKDHNLALIHPKELFSAVQYEKAVDGADLVYELDSVLLRERIVLHSADEGREKYEYTLHWDGESKETRDGLLFCEGGEPVFRLHAPELIDNKGEWAQTKTELKKTEEGEYAYRVTVPLDWLRAEERSYPVVLDPSVGVPFRDNIEDYHISASGDVKDRDSLMVGSHNAFRSVIKPNVSGISFEQDGFLQEADLVLSRYVYDGTNDGDVRNVAVQLYQLTEPWPTETQPDYLTAIAQLYDKISATYVDSQAKAGSVNERSSWNITDIALKWIADEDRDKGLLLKSYDDNKYVYFRSSGYSAAYSTHPYLTFLYADARGKDDRWHYHSQGTSRCGTGSINTYSGSLHIERVDGQIQNGCLPISVGFAYNDADKAVDRGYGKGYTMSYAQSLEERRFPDTVYGTETKYLCLTDGQGTKQYYKFKSGNEWEYELDHETKIIVASSGGTATLENKKGNKLIFAVGTSNDSLLHGRLTTVQDAYGNKTHIQYTSDDLQELRVSSVREELVGQATGQQSIQFEYCTATNRLKTLTVPNGLEVEYTYTDGYLTTVKYKDTKEANYTYDTAGRLVSMQDPNGYRLQYTWDTVAGMDRVIGVSEHLAATPTTQEETGRSLTFTYTRNTTKVVDDRNRDTIYQFDNYGQVRSVRDQEGRAVFSAYNTAVQSVTELTAVSKMQKSVTNLLLNHGFETGTAEAWTVSSSTNVKAVTTKAHTGKYSLELKNQGTATQTVTVDGGQEGEEIKTFTLSAYFTGAAGSKLQAQNSGVVYESEASAGGTDWERLHTTFQVPHGLSTVTVSLLAPSSGTAYCDGVQLEQSDAPSRYNLVNNGAFWSATAGFTVRSEHCTAEDAVITLPAEASAETHPEGLGNQVFHMVGSPQFEKTIDQIIEVPGGATGDAYSFGCWLMSNGTPAKGQQDNTPSYYYNGIKELEVALMSYSSVRSSGIVTFDANTREWQFGCGGVVATGAYNKIRIRMRLCCICNDTYFDGIQLYKEPFATAYTYSSNGNLTGRTSLIGQTTQYVYTNHDDVAQTVDPRGNRSRFHYDDYHGLIRTQTPMAVVQAMTRSAAGMVTETKVYENEHLSTYIKTSREYTACALAQSVTDARGKTVTYTYKTDTRQQEIVTDPKGNTTQYAYGDENAMRLLASLTSTDTGTVTYTYDNTHTKLTGVTRDTTTYGLTYDGWNRPLETKVGNVPLSANEYDPETRLLKKVTYGNSFQTRYEYDDLDRVTKIYETFNGTETLCYEFLYNNEGDMYALRNYRTGRVSFFDYDHAGRCMACREFAFTLNDGQVTLGAQLSGYGYQYDANNNLTKLTCTAAGSTWDTVYVYDKDNRPTVATFSNGKKLTHIYDGLGRLTRKRLGLSSNYDAVLTYHNGANGSKTALLATYQNGSDTAYAYAYDDNGNISSITRGSTSVTYQYNGANELIRENNGFTNQTVTYEYDDWGNLTEKNVYAYTTATDPGTPTDTKTYDYDNTDWGDQLTGYNGQTITYDPMGNPTMYRGKTLTWRGKQLTGIADGTDTIAYSYDENGLRLQKTVNNVVTDYYYNGKVLIGLVKGNDTLRFSYDAAGNAAAVNHNGTYYYYLRNGQGDIVKLIDGSKTTVVEYTYDSWGKPLSCTGTLATTLGALNPFRYRGYVYDEETQWYYLKSRYYDPETCRFISADVLLSTGQGVLGHNCYAYCLNNPICMFDDKGDVPEWIKKCIKAVAEAANTIINTIKPFISEFELTDSIGISISGTPGIHAFNGAIIVSTDTKGNIAVQYSIDYAIHTGSPSASVTILGSTTNAPDVYQLNGRYSFVGGSFGAPVEGVPVVGGADALLLDSSENGNTVYYAGLSGKIGIGVPGAEGHTGWGYTYTLCSFNLFDKIESIHAAIMDW